VCILVDMSNYNERETMNTTTSAGITSLISDAVSLRDYSVDARKSGEARNISRLVRQANDADRGALENIRQAQEILEAMAAEILSDLS
jgi:hypothetical protein